LSSDRPTFGSVPVPAEIATKIRFGTGSGSRQNYNRNFGSGFVSGYIWDFGFDRNSCSKMNRNLVRFFCLFLSQNLAFFIIKKKKKLRNGFFISGFTVLWQFVGYMVLQNSKKLYCHKLRANVLAFILLLFLVPVLVSVPVSEQANFRILFRLKVLYSNFGSVPVSADNLYIQTNHF
jgi:hypothetical protein